MYPVNDLKTPKMRRICVRCGKMYMPNGVSQKVCENCKSKGAKSKKDGKKKKNSRKKKM